MTRVLRRTLAILVACIMVFVVAGLPLYVWPSQDPPGKADVVFVIGPPDEWRVQWAEDLISEGKAGTLMVSVPSARLVPVCTQQHNFPMICERPDPFTTQGEARMLKQQMAQHNWTTATVITMTPHIARTRVLMERCVPTGVTVVGHATGLTVSDWADQYLYQTAAFVKVWLTPGC